MCDSCSSPLPPSGNRVSQTELCPNISVGPNLSEFFLMLKASNRGRSERRMRVAVETPGLARDPHMRVNHEQILAMALQRGSIEMGWRRSELRKFTYDAGEMILARRHVETWART